MVTPTIVHVQSSMCRYYLRAATNQGMASIRTNTVDNVVYVIFSMDVLSWPHHLKNGSAPYTLHSVIFVQSTTASSCNNEESKDGDEAATEDEVMTFHTNCSHCNSPADTRMKLVGIIPLKIVCSSL